MLSSIHPLGERARNNRWLVTVTAFTIAAMVAAGAIGFGLGYLGSRSLGTAGANVLILLVAVFALVAASLDAAGIRPPGPTRQVNETWIGHYRGWVYGGAFGAQLGAGLATYVVTWGVYATLASEFLTAAALPGAVIGATFGLGRSIALIFAGTIDRPSLLTAFHSRMARLGPWVRRGAAAGTMAVAVLFAAGNLS